MFLFDVGVGSSVGEVAFAASAGEISGLGVSFGASAVSLGLHLYELFVI